MKILVISDIHANLDALNAVLNSVGDSCAGLFCLGDVTGYGPDAESCVGAVRALSASFSPCVVLSGNHDAALSGKLPKGWFNKGAQFSVDYTKRSLSRESLDWLASLPAQVDYSSTVVLSHGSPVEPLTGYLWGGYETILALSWIADRSGRICFCGHTHEAAAFSGYWGEATARRVRFPAPGETASSSRGPIIVNPGSVGFPRSFNGGRTADMPGDSAPIDAASYPAYFAIWDTESESVEFREVRYDRRPLEDRIDEMK